MAHRYCIDMKTRYIQCPVTGNLVPVEEYRAVDPDAPMVIPDIAPYQSMIDGRMITSRSQHREHLRAHGCIEIGNERIDATPKGVPDVDPQHRKELIAAQIRELGHEGFKKAMKRDVDFIKWNSNGLPRSR